MFRRQNPKVCRVPINRQMRFSSVLDVKKASQYKNLVVLLNLPSIVSVLEYHFQMLKVKTNAKTNRMVA